MRDVVELKVHGVSGTPPKDLLKYPEELIERKYGDGDAGFYRRRDREVDERTGNVLEAYSWGGLTSGPGSRALWLLFVPFIFVNLAHWMLPPTERKRVASIGIRLLRLLGLTLTATLLLAAVSMSVDMVGWQCAGMAQCADRLGPLQFLGSWDRQHRLAVTALPVLLMVVALLFMGKASPRLGEPPPHPADLKPTTSPLNNSRFWNADPSVTRLRDCHLTVWFSGLAAVVLLAALRYSSGPIHALSSALLALNGLFVLAAVGFTLYDRATARGGIGMRGDQTEKPTKVTYWMRVGSLLFTIASLVFVCFAKADYPSQDSSAPNTVTAPTPLPYLQTVIHWLMGVQVALLILLFLTTWFSRSVKKWADGYRPTVGGLTAWFVATLAWLIAGGFSIGLGFWVARYLGDPVRTEKAAACAIGLRTRILEIEAPQTEAFISACSKDQLDRLSSTSFQDKVEALASHAPLVLPRVYFVGVVTNLVVVVALIITATAVWLITRRTAKARYEDTFKDYKAETNKSNLVLDPRELRRLEQMRTTRLKQISTARAQAGVTDRAPTIVAALILCTIVAFVVVGVLSPLVRPSGAWATWLDGGWQRRIAELLPAFGQTVTTLLIAGLVGLAYKGFRDRRTRRVIAVLFDVVTFWPHAAHPLGPPCYAERAVPDLWDRIRALANGSEVVIAAHSQGTIISAAVMIRDDHPREHVALLTFGAPLRRLYARNFPAYFGFQAFDSIRRDASRRWLNLWAYTDPIGGWVFDEGSTDFSTIDGPVDRRLKDAERPEPTDGAYPPICGHSGFWERDEYNRAVTLVAGRPVEEEPPAPAEAAPMPIQPPLRYPSLAE